MWKPKEVIVNDQVKDDPATAHILRRCPGVPVRYVDAGKSEDIKSVSGVLTGEESTMLGMIQTPSKIVCVCQLNEASME